MKSNQAGFATNLKRFASSETGTTAIEYALIAACISIVIVGTATSVGEALVSNFYDKIVDGMETAAASGS